jgi:predicted ester cyclase
VADHLREWVAEEVVFRGFYPLPRLEGVAALTRELWQPLKRALPDLHRETTIFLGGRSWVCGMGHFVGTFAQPWLGVPATGQPLRIRFGEFCAVEGDKITEIHLLVDLVDVMRQAGITVLPPDNGDPALFPEPTTGAGLLHTPQDATESEKSYRLITGMLFKGLNQFDQHDMGSMGMAHFWDENMHWYGPGGIGGCRSLQEFQAFHQSPFLTAFPNRYCTQHDAIIAEGQFAAASGFPGVIGTHDGIYLGHPATGREIRMNLMDFWYREGDVLLENWVLLDIVDIFRQFGVDLLASPAQAGG